MRNSVFLIFYQGKTHLFFRFWVCEFQTVGTKFQWFKAALFFCQNFWIILDISYNRASDPCKLYPDLVMPSGVQMDVEFAAR